MPVQGIRPICESFNGLLAMLHCSFLMPICIMRFSSRNLQLSIWLSVIRLILYRSSQRNGGRMTSRGVRRVVWCVVMSDFNRKS